MPVTDRQLADATDDVLLERVVRRDEDALAALYDRYSRLLFGLVLRIVRDRSEAEEVLQEVFLAVWSKAASYQAARGVPAAWLVRLARNRGIDRRRANRARARTVALVADDPPPVADSPAAVAVQSEKRTYVAQALAELPDEQRQLIVRAYYSGATQSELAALFGLPLGTVKTRVRSALITLRERLAPYE